MGRRISTSATPVTSPSAPLTTVYATDEDIAELNAKPVPDGPGKPTPPYVDPMAANRAAVAEAVVEAKEQQIAAQAEAMREMKKQMEAMAEQMKALTSGQPKPKRSLSPEHLAAMKAGKAEEAERLKRANIRAARHVFERYQQFVL